MSQQSVRVDVFPVDFLMQEHVLGGFLFFSSWVGSVTIDIQQKKERENFEKLKLETIIFNNRHFDCRCASLKMCPKLFTRQN